MKTQKTDDQLRMESLAQKAAEKMEFGSWEDDQTTREIATAEDEYIALHRLRRIIADALIGIEVVTDGMSPSRREE